MNEWQRDLYWTDLTIYEILPAPLPVPEPASAVMLLGGLATLAGWSRRRLRGRFKMAMALLQLLAVQAHCLRRCA
ncbi:PEP-CTERM sorting domain-containing protein [Pseudoduganella violaceinigra]|uniref:PEP-CTERM sorting domain-containing protein n=1 Tax=Pseudoduganella violaceinigra TaxID=246602 RepID=UPI0004257175|nr:PEP-CTERM sorting domain-containing protein [Pseudoduganella violaceinigra]